MSDRSPEQTAEEEGIFNAFLTAYPSFARCVVKHEPHDGSFPDRDVELHDGTLILFELTRWLHTQQTAKSKELQRLTEIVEEALGDQSTYTPKHIRYVQLGPQWDFPRFKEAEMESFRDDVWRLIKTIDAQWPNERFWNQGHSVTDLQNYKTLSRYIARIYFGPLALPDHLDNVLPAADSWIFVEAPGGAYSPDTILGSLWNILRQKIEEKYGPIGQVRLLVYYSEAVMHNSPWYGIQYRTFSDVAKEAARRVASQTTFEKVYLFQALHPKLEAYEIFPSFVKCC